LILILSPLSLSFFNICPLHKFCYVFYSGQSPGKLLIHTSGARVRYFSPLDATPAQQFTSLWPSPFWRVLSSPLPPLPRAWRPS
jgi:hypothetical protein